MLRWNSETIYSIRALLGTLLRGLRIVYIAFRNIVRNVRLSIGNGGRWGSNIRWYLHDNGGWGVSGRGGIGRRNGLKIRQSAGCEGSSPFVRTNIGYRL